MIMDEFEPDSEPTTLSHMYNLSDEKFKAAQNAHFEHRIHENGVWESTQFEGKHDTREFWTAIHDARQRDMTSQQDSEQNGGHNR